MDLWAVFGLQGIDSLTRQTSIQATINQAYISLGHSVPGLGTLQSLTVSVCRLYNVQFIGMHVHVYDTYLGQNYIGVQSWVCIKTVLEFVVLWFGDRKSVV